MLKMLKTSRDAINQPFNKTIAYFCAEYALSDSLPIYSGGLGVLAGDILQQAAAMQLPFIGIGLFYRKGYFHQFLEADGQHERIQEINPAQVPLTLLLDDKGDTLLLEVPLEERIIFVQVWSYPVGKNLLYLLDTDHWKNSPEDRAITDQLYASGVEKRITQEVILGLGGYRLLQALAIKPDIYHLNEGHSAFVALELIREELSHSSYEEALQQVKKKLIFTNHTLIAAGNDVFPADLIAKYLGNYIAQSGIGMERVLALGATDQVANSLSMTMLALRTAGISNAVSRLHAKKAVTTWPGFNFEYVTNGVHLPSWVAPEFQQLWEQHIANWRQQSSNLNIWKGVNTISDTILWQTHQEVKKRMLKEVYARTGISLNEEVLTVVWARRFASYKRPELIFNDLERLKKMLFASEQSLQIIVAGKSHPADTEGKEMIEFIENLAQFDLKHRVVFVDDYSLTLARFLVSGADVWLNTPVFGLEASGTSGMKASSNGVLQCTVPDGWANEVEWYGVGFTLPIEDTASALYDLLERKIIPLYYRHNAQKLPQGWLDMMRYSISIISPRFSSARMLEEYISKIYLKLSKG